MGHYRNVCVNLRTAGALIGSLSGPIWKISKDKPEQSQFQPLEAVPRNDRFRLQSPQSHETTDAVLLLDSTITRGTVNPTKRAPKGAKNSAQRNSSYFRYSIW